MNYKKEEIREKTIEDLNWRYATKVFDKDKKISNEDLNVLLESLRMSPSSFGLEPWKFIVVTNDEVKEKLREASWNQSQVTNASHMIILLARKDIDEKYVDNFVKRMAKIKGVDEEKLSQYKETILGHRKQTTKEAILEWNKKQVYIALGFLMSAAAVLRIDSCPMEGFDAASYDKILRIEESEYTSTVACPVGYRSEEDSHQKDPKVRFDKSEVVDFID